MEVAHVQRFPENVTNMMRYPQEVAHVTGILYQTAPG